MPLLGNFVPNAEDISFGSEPDKSANALAEGEAGADDPIPLIKTRQGRFATLNRPEEIITALPAITKFWLRGRFGNKP